MFATSKIYITPTAYLMAERASEVKSEYRNGEIHTMTGSNESHNLITANVMSILALQLRCRPDKVYPSNLRVKIDQANVYTYADVIVVNDQPQFEDEETDTLLNPTVIIEVFAKSTEKYDRGRKFENYRTLNSLSEYLLIAQDRPHIEQYVRQADNQWLLSEAKVIEDVIELPTIECKLALADVYDKVDFQSRPAVLREVYNVKKNKWFEKFCSYSNNWKERDVLFVDGISS